MCFVVSDLLGLVTNSGIGTATSYTSLVLAKAGYDVTLVHIRDSAGLDAVWKERYRSAGVAVEQAPRVIAAPGCLAASYSVYQHLKDREFEVIAFQDWLALGWASTQARFTGLDFEGTQLIQMAHGPEAWLEKANLDVAVDADRVALAHAGQVSAELSDAVVGPSRYLLNWMADAGWRLPTRRFTVPYFTEGHARAAMGEADQWPAPAPADPVTEIAFFGRLERRKGVQLFVDALNRLDPATLEGVTISFLGREATFTTDDVVAMLDGPVRRAAADVKFHTSFDNDEACSHLNRPGKLAVIASLVDNSPNTVYECIERGIRFVATTTGGTHELVHEDDRSRCLVEPEAAALAAALDAALGSVADTAAPVRPAFDMNTSLRLWEDILAWEPPARVEVREAPLVTAVLPHHDRPALLITAVEALDAQDYTNLEVVVVDDGSQRSESHRVLGEIEAHPWHHRLRVVRQENRYLGAARNTGAAVGRGDLLAFVDDDDVATGDFVSRLVRALHITGADAVTCAMRSFTRPAGAPEPADSRGAWVFAGGPLHLAAVQNCLGGAPAMIRRSVFDSIGGYHERHGVGFEDWHLYVRLLFAGHTLVAVPEPLYWYRLHPDSMRSTMSDFHSAQVILEEFRAALPPALGPLADLVYGQHQVIAQRGDELAAEVALRDRMLWLAEERVKRLKGGSSARVAGMDRNPSDGWLDVAPDGDKEKTEGGARDLVQSLRRKLEAGWARLHQVRTLKSAPTDLRD